MDYHRFDQAEGLRRMLGVPKQRVHTFWSAGRHKNRKHVLHNLAASLVYSGRSVILFDATCSEEGAGFYGHAPQSGVTLLDVMNNRSAPEDVCNRTPMGFDIVRLARSPSEIVEKTVFRNSLDQLLEAVTADADIVMVDARLDRRDDFVPGIIGSSEMNLVVEISKNSNRETSNSILGAYSLMKRLANRFGRIPFGVLVSGVDEAQSQTVFGNMEQIASEKVALQLHFLGHVPQDEDMVRAAGLGRSVIDAFPMALSAYAFRRIAGAFIQAGAPVQTVYEMAGA